jgi:hypothetical protein
LAKFDFNSYARRGAEVRLAELNQELAAIYAAFPDLRSGRGARGGRKQAALAAPASATPRARKRRGMSAAQRKAVSARMKRYWAERRKAKKPA